MLKKIALIVITTFTLTLNVNASSDGELLIKKNEPAEIKECWEGFNRVSFALNQGLDKIIFKPVASVYRTLPTPLKSGVSNSLDNLSNVVTIPNNLLQGEFSKAGVNTGRFIINTTVGVLGLIDVATMLGLEEYEKEDYGQTLAVHGVGPGCYLVLPILGPSTARDTLGLVADTFIDPFAHVTIRERELLGVSGNDIDYFSVKGTSAIDFRADNDANFESLEKNSIDLYSSMKSVYLQSRENKVGNSDGDQEDWDLDK